MRKSISLMPIPAIFAGVAGFILRKRELSSAIDTVTGLAERWSKFTILLAALSLIAAAAFIIYASLNASGRTFEPSYNAALSPNGILAFFLAILGGTAIIAGGVAHYLDARLFRVGIIDFVFALFAVLSGACQIILAFGAFKRKTGKASHIAAVVTPLFFCLWLIMTYKSRATDPELLNFCGMCMALMAAIFSFYFSAGFAFGHAKPRCLIVFGLLAVYMCTVALADFTDISKRLILIGVIIISSVNVSSLKGNSIKK